MSSFEYTGKEELEHSLLMVRYNTHIARTLSQFIKAKDRVLDYGAGIGVITDCVKGVSGVQPTCFEIDKAQQKKLEAKGYKVHGTFSPVKKEPKFQVVYSSNVLEHIEDDVQALKDIHGILDKDGVLALWVPAFECIWTKMDDRVGHLRRYKRADLTKKLEEAGFTVQKIYYQDSVGFFLSFLFNFIGNKEGQASLTSLKIFDRFLFPLSRLLDCLVKPWFGKNVVAIAHKK